MLAVPPLVLRLQPIVRLTDDEFFELCQLNRELQMKRTTRGELIIMPPTGGENGKRNANLTMELGIWNRQTKLGIVFDSSTSFKLPNGADRSPDVSWVRLKKWASLTPEQRDKFLPLCPNFAIELRSRSDRLEDLQEKMQEYLDNGLRLGWLIDPKTQRVEVYRPGLAVEVLSSPKTLSGEDVLEGFVLDLQPIFDLN
ncbi:MAG: Uma2 family endonuclease [Chroococcidiopsidaceae cyanobacterium CP_BM_RX_35]|nr:Uma2 family endonuclease [Chroococcidiopsidaceae cyanobacterium CP_BM_RX_35]